MHPITKKMKQASTKVKRAQPYVDNIRTKIPGSSLEVSSVVFKRQYGKRRYRLLRRTDSRVFNIDWLSQDRKAPKDEERTVKTSILDNPGWDFDPMNEPPLTPERLAFLKPPVIELTEEDRLFIKYCTVIKQPPLDDDLKYFEEPLP